MCSTQKILTYPPPLSPTPPSRLPDHRGITPRDAARIGPYPRPCLALLKEAERVNLLHKVKHNTTLTLPFSDFFFSFDHSHQPPTPSPPTTHQARILVEVEESLVAAGAAGDDGGNGELLASLPRVCLRPVPPSASCW